MEIDIAIYAKQHGIPLRDAEAAATLAARALSAMERSKGKAPPAVAGPVIYLYMEAFAAGWKKGRMAWTMQ